MAKKKNVQLKEDRTITPKFKGRSNRSGRLKTIVILGLTLVAIVLALVPAWLSLARVKRRDWCAINLAQIGLAIQNTEDTTRTVDDIRDKNGEPLLSWRVRILPFIEHSALFDEFHLDEPWDSPHNRKLLARMPEVYRCPSQPDDSTMTRYQVITGPAMLFSGNTGATPWDIPDGRDSTILVVEAEDLVPWTKPQDIPHNPGDSIPDFSQVHPGGWLALFVDGTVRSIPHDTDEATIVAMITPDGGESISIDRFPLNQSVLDHKRRVEDLMKQRGLSGD